MALCCKAAFSAKQVVGKNRDFRPISSYISETIQDTAIVNYYGMRLGNITILMTLTLSQLSDLYSLTQISRSITILFKVKITRK